MTFTQTIKKGPLLMKGEMVNATLEDRKTRTRRVAKGVKMFSKEYDERWYPFVLPPSESNPQWSWWEGPSHGPSCYHFATCPYGKRGDRLWVKESHWQFGRWFPKSNGKGKYWAIYAKLPACVRYGQQAPISTPGGNTECHWRRVPGIHMPRWASRITLEITGIRVERVQDITEEDAIAEGVEALFSAAQVEDRPDLALAPMPYKNYLWHGTPGLTNKQIDGWDWQYSSYEAATLSFSSLWHSINAGRGFGWETNCWVWVIEYKRVEVSK